MFEPALTAAASEYLLARDQAHESTGLEPPVVPRTELTCQWLTVQEMSESP